MTSDSAPRIGPDVSTGERCSTRSRAQAMPAINAAISGPRPGQNIGRTRTGCPSKSHPTATSEVTALVEVPRAVPELAEVAQVGAATTGLSSVTCSSPAA
jgi:hypothetical protein